MSSVWALTGCAFVLLGVAGEHYGFATLSAAVCVTLVTVAWDISSRRPRVLRLLDIWCVAFAYLFGSEVLITLPDVRADFGIQLASVAEGIVVATFGASLLGYAAGSVFTTRRNQKLIDTLYRGQRRQQLALMCLSTLILAYVVLAVSPSDLLTQRSARMDTGVQGEAFVAVVAAMIVQAALTAQAMTARRRGLLLAYPVSVAVVSFLILYCVGTRYFLGFFACVVLFYAGRLCQPLSNRRVAVFAVTVFVLVAAQGTMRVVRGTGLGGTDADSIASLLSQPEIYVSSEDMLRVHAWVQEKRVFANTGHAPEHAFLLYWWVPRTFWPSKPTMDGYWLAHEVMADGDVGVGHNVAGGFLLPALLDFGPNLTLAVCFVYGLALWRLDQFMTAHSDPSDPASVVVALLPFTVFFGMRSPQTSAIFVETCIVVYLPIFLFVRARRRIRFRRPASRYRGGLRGGASPARADSLVATSGMPGRWAGGAR